MTHGWEPGTQYNLGDVVSYGGNEYKIIQPHRSQGDWTPDVTPALWGKIPKCHQGGQKQGGHGGQQQGHGGQQQEGYGGQQQGGYQQAPQYSEADKQKSWTEKTDQHVDIDHEERKKEWYDLTPERKKELEIGGGLAAGVALLGAGYAAYSHHEKSEEEKKANVWGAQNWLHDAQSSTEKFHQSGPRGPCEWVLVHGTQIPQGAIQGGEVNGKPIFICRAFHEGSVQVGKCGYEFNKGAVVGYGHREVEFDTYEVLIGDANGVKWVDVRGKLDAGRLGIRPVEAGKERDGTPLYIAQAPHKGATHCGKVSEKLDCAFIPVDGKEVEVETYRVLAYA